MIIQARGDDLLFVTQRDHAGLAAEIMAHWRMGGLGDHPRRGAILAATGSHDDGWREEDDMLHVGDGGEPLDFVAVPSQVKQRIWPRAAERLAPGSAYVAALVAQHALTIYAALHRDEAWRAFMARMTAIRDDLLARVPGEAPHLMHDYPFVRIGDQLSLIFCNGWTAPMSGVGYRAILRGTTLEITPDPFEGHRIPLRVAARAIRARAFAGASDLRAACRDAPAVTLEGEAIGSRVPAA